MSSLASAYNHVGSSQPTYSYGGNADAGDFYQKISSTQVGGRRRRKKTTKRRRKKSARRKSLRQYM
jgi:hypothetical protein